MYSQYPSAFSFGMKVVIVAILLVAVVFSISCWELVFSSDCFRSQQGFRQLMVTLTGFFFRVDSKKLRKIYGNTEKTDERTN